MLAALVLSIVAPAQTVINSITTSTHTVSPTNPVTTDETDYTYQNQVTSVTSFSTGTNTYAVTGVADLVFVRRDTVNPDQSSVWYRGTSGTYTGPHGDTYGQVLLSNNLNAGSDNTFANGTAVNEGNIERLDFVYSSPLTVNSSLGFAVFDRGAQTVHDGFAIAAITGWDYTTNLPTSYSILIAQAPNWAGAVNTASNFDYTLFRYDTGDTLYDATHADETGNQGIGGLVFSAADLGLAVGTQVYGYSLFGYDVVTTGSLADLIDWTSSRYPTNTNGDTGGGGIDLAAVNGIAFSVVPEASTWSAAGLSLVGLALFLRSRRRRAAA